MMYTDDDVFDANKNNCHKLLEYKIFCLNFQSNKPSKSNGTHVNKYC